MTITASDRPVDGTIGRENGWYVRFRPYVGLIPFGVLILLAVIGPWIAPQPATDVVGTPSTSPSGAYPFGTDSNGFDVLSRTLTAFRIDVLIALAVTALATVLALIIGTFAGMYGSQSGLVGRLASMTGRIIDLVQALPVMIAGLVIVSFFGRNAVVITCALSLVLMPFQARLMRTEVLRTRTDGYVTAARMSGESEPRILLRHVIPNSIASTIENTSAIFGMAIIFCAGLGFLGVGIPLPEAEWGNMLSSAAPDAAVGRWWPALFPVLALAYSVWAASKVTTLISQQRRR
ncbi:ABC transporter permease [Gordonia rhizosphera]|uniref:Putative peptide ABC transporter permease protein n=1 Tax=Gordonia rhizosphera NBRC 16068 TaxID=1108045 RepID=K6VVV4_9ACTN|nr:ABC transporter permease [Gordonia rhizosphera]GAB91035.1 putative peptide ABC transporter permease protein [Gordonia rhizosphera NBRC 16068]